MCSIRDRWLVRPVYKGSMETVDIMKPCTGDTKAIEAAAVAAQKLTHNKDSLDYMIDGIIIS